MKFKTIALCIAFSSSVFAADTKPSDASVKELLAVNDSRQMLDMAKGQVGNIANGPIQQALAGKPLTPEIKKVVDDYSVKVSGLINSGLNWEAVEPAFVEVYQSNFTQGEVNDIVAFYKSAAGRAMVQKGPALVQMSSQKLQAQLGPIMQQVQQLQQDTMAKLQAALAK